jgi:hypothetical protein
MMKPRKYSIDFRNWVFNRGRSASSTSHGLRLATNKLVTPEFQSRLTIQGSGKFNGKPFRSDRLTVSPPRSDAETILIAFFLGAFFFLAFICGWLLFSSALRF